MHDPKPPKDQQSVPVRRGSRSLAGDIGFPQELQELSAKVARPRKDRPANASDLHSSQEIALESEREDLRAKQEKRRELRFFRRGLAVVLAILTLIALTSAAVVAVDLARGGDSLVLPGLGCLSGSGASAALLWRAYAEKLRRE